MSPQYGMMSVGSYVVENSDDFDPSIASVYGTLKDGVITFPYGSLEMKLETMGWYPTNSSGLHRIILPGYRAKEYDLEIIPGVSDQYGNLAVRVSMGADISSVRLAVFEGTLAESVVEEKARLIASGASEEETGEVIITRRILSVSKVYDVAPVAIPANDATVISARSYCDGVIAELEAERLRAEAEAEERRRKVIAIKILAEAK